MTPETAKWLNSLPAPDDKEGWNKRLQDQFTSILGGIAKPQPIVDAEDAEFFDVNTQEMSNG